MNDMVRKKVSFTLPEDVVEWIDQQVKTPRFASKSHLVEFALSKLKETLDKEKRE